MLNSRKKLDFARVLSGCCVASLKHEHVAGDMLDNTRQSRNTLLYNNALAASAGRR